MKLLKNILLIVFSTVIVKIITLLSQVILGYQLNIDNFGYYATALGAVSIFFWMKNGAILQFAVRETLNKTRHNYFGYITLFNISSSICILFSLLFYIKDDSYIWTILLAFSICQLFSLAGFSNRFNLIIKEKYNELSVYEIKYGFILSISTIIAAFIFKDERCFSVGLIFSLLYEITIFLQNNKYKSLFDFNFNGFLLLWSEAKWLLVGSLGSTLTLKGSFIVLSYTTSSYVLGVYYFAFQISSSISVVVGDSIRKVIMPFITKRTLKEQQLEIYKKLILFFSLVLIPITLILYNYIGDIILLVWGDKWIDAIKPSQFLLSILSISILVNLSYSQLEASGQWKLRNIIQVIDGFLLLVVTYIGTLLGGIDSIVMCILIKNIAFGLLQIIMPFLKK
ncbi:oligosaccharide flippase family protein [Photobacterium damselae]|uniref:oligosaccharide flippase family protein n=1 Tax=Photobacterium damselae TaxID=38293 RepID=UPI004068528F